VAGLDRLKKMFMRLLIYPILLPSTFYMLVFFTNMTLKQD